MKKSEKKVIQGYTSGSIPLRIDVQRYIGKKKVIFEKEEEEEGRRRSTSS